MNTRYDNHAPFAHGHRSHPVSLLSAAVATADKKIIDALAMHEDIQLCAFLKWEAAGKPTGDGVHFWLEAEQQIAGGAGAQVTVRDDQHPDNAMEKLAVGQKENTSGRGNSQDADRHSGVRHPRSSKM